MYKVKNIALKNDLINYGVKSLEELSDQQLIELTLKFGCIVAKPPQDALKTTVATSMNESFRSPATITRFDRINQLNSDLGLSIYMGREHWEERHEKQLVDRGGVSILQRVDDGRQTFKLMKDMRVGIYQLEPGQEAEVDWTETWVKEVLIKHPVMSRIELTDLSDGEKIIRETITETKDGKEEIVGFEFRKGSEAIVKQQIRQGPASLREIPWNDLVKLAKKKGIVIAGKSKATLISELSELEN